MAPILKITDLVLQREQKILRGLNWEVQPGEQWALLGPNGSGKTTLLHALTGYEPPSAGQIEILGKTYGKSDWRSMRKKLGIVSPWVASHLQARETSLAIVLSGREAMVNYWGRPPANLLAEAEKILERIHCGHLAERPWIYLSQGERQRILIGRALMARHKILLLDEACAGLDLVARDRFLGFLNDLSQAKDLTLIMVTHHIEEIFPAITHVLLLKDGKIAISGPKEQVLNAKNMSEVFSAKLKVSKQDESYSACLKGPTHDKKIFG